MTSDFKPIAIIGGVSLLLLGVLVAGLVSQLEPSEHTLPAVARGEARRNPLLAAERFLRRMGIAAESRARLDELPPVDHVLILAMENRLLTEARAERLLDWMHAGGMLVVAPHLSNGWTTDETWNDPLLRDLGVFVLGEDEQETGVERETVDVVLPHGDEADEVRFFSQFGLLLDAEGAEEQNSPLAWGQVAVSSEHTLGRAVVLNDMRFMRNDEIGDLDHARFLWRLARDEGRRTSVWLIYGWNSEPLWIQLVKRAWAALLAGGVLLAAWVGRRATRLGPLESEAAPGSRSLMEHVDALGYFLWRCGRHDTLVEAARDALRRRMASRRPRVAAMSRERQTETLAAASTVRRERIETAVYGPTPHKRDAFIRTMRTIETLRREL